jgi:hypothetical protein
MKTAVSLFGSLLLFSACAHTPMPMASTPVKLTVTSTTASNQLINDVRNKALAMIEKEAPNARPLIVTVSIDVVYSGGGGFSSGIRDYSSSMSHDGSTRVMAFGNISPDVSGRMPVAEMSPNPGMNGFTPTVGLGSGMSGVYYPDTTARQIWSMRLSYTIADANGRIIEEKQQWQPSDRPRHTLERVFPLLFDVARVYDTAAFLASRVAALSSK